MPYTCYGNHKYKTYLVLIKTHYNFCIESLFWFFSENLEMKEGLCNVIIIQLIKYNCNGDLFNLFSMYVCQCHSISQIKVQLSTVIMFLRFFLLYYLWAAILTLET